MLRRDRSRHVPSVLPFAASFMTESFACLFSMACVYCALRAVQAKDGTRRSAGYGRWRFPG